MLNMKNIIVTGATGYIGRNLIRYFLDKGYNIYAVVRTSGSIWSNKKNVYEICCPMDNYNRLNEILSDKKIDIFYHLAWNGSAGILRSDYKVQLENVQYCCDAAVVAKKLNCSRFITTGTITENIAKQVLDKNYSSQNLIYGLSKIYAHNLLDIVCRNQNLEYVWAQLSNVYGGDNTSGNLISYTINEFNKDSIPTFGPCLQPYNFTHINDVVHALYLIGISKNVLNEYVISNGECKLLKEYLEELSKIYGKTVGIGIREDDGVEYKKEWFDNKKLCELGFTSQFNFSDGIKKLYRM